MRRTLHALRGPLSALVLLGMFARLLLPLPALAGAGLAAFDTMARATLCLPSGKAVPDADGAPAAVAGGAHCPLCRLPDADLWHPTTHSLLPTPAWAAHAVPVAAATAQLAPPLPRGPPPARAPPSSPNAA